MIERKYDEASWPNARWYTVFVWKESIKPQNIDNTGKKNELFFVSRTSVDELSSTFYAEFRYINKISYQAGFQRYRGI
jgi:hypothetical protein